MNSVKKPTNEQESLCSKVFRVLDKIKLVLEIGSLSLVILAALGYNTIVTEIGRSTALATTTAENSGIPSVSISAPSEQVVEQHGSVKFKITFSPGSIIDLKTSDIGIAGDGVKLTKKILDGDKENERIVLLEDITGPQKKVSIAIRAGAARNENGTSIQTPKSIAFQLD